MRRSPSAALVAVLAVSALALAGDEANPEITDAPGDAGPAAAWGDIVNGWLNDTNTDIVGTLKLAQLPASPPEGTAYYLVADIGTGPNATFGWGVGIIAGQPAFFYGHWDRQAGPTDFNTGQGTITTGAPQQPGTVEMLLPRAFADNVTAGTKLTTLEAGTGQLNPAFSVAPLPLPLPGTTGFVQTDTATGNDYTVASGPRPVTAAPVAGGSATSGNTTGSGAGAPNATAPDGSGNMTGEPPATPARTPDAGLLGLAVVATAALAVRRRR